MEKGIFKDRQQAMEANYFQKQDAKLIDRLRHEARLDEIAGALAGKLEVDNPALLVRVRELGVTADTAPAFLLAPLVQVAWAEDSVTRAEHDAVMRLAEGRGVEAGSPAHAQLEEWLKVRPADALFDAAVEALKVGFSVLPLKEREERIKRMVDACREVAAASGSILANLLFLGTGISSSEMEMLDAIASTLRSHD
jgi:hypothetical protein